tara:strand:+ start:687 stop:1109 length:423 start_codon:yes stop_codon:yes gene_type:complete
MKIYLCLKEPEEKTHEWVSNIAVFNGFVEDSEATSVVCDSFLSSFVYNELEGVLKKIASKMRLGAELIIISPDIKTLAQRICNEEIDTPTLNDILFKCGPIKSLSSIEELHKLMPENLQITHKNFDAITSSVIVKAERIR